MELETLLQYLLPKEIFEYFDFKEINKGENNQLHIHLDEKPIKPSCHSEKELISNGFDEPVRIQDFPIRDKAVYFIVRRRKWKDKQTGKIYSTHWGLTANGTSYSKEFADFLKGLFGQLPNQQ
jgi:transposase